ncbi:MAG: lytic transglycosylase domain-containing protein [Peptoniphilaceae bacterium]|nr:lytic transglycosylase domain-containing protein [Peptoniphilaceae bacterium]
MLCALVAAAVFVLSRRTFELPLEAIHIAPSLDSKIQHNAADQGLDPDLVRAVIFQESRFDPDATSRVGAQGLMQLMPQTAVDIADMRGEEPPTDLYDIDTNLAYGITYLAYLLERFDGKVPTALAAYNAGPTVVAEWLTDPSLSADGLTLSSIPYDETRGYVEKVMKYYESYREVSARVTP